MLRNLIIRNYALIEHLDLEFGPGLTIITGETGAGKSIMLGALSLVMGGRADTKVIADGGSKSVVQAVFTDIDPELRQLLDEKGIDWVESDHGVSELVVRRELTATGRSKIFVNDVSVTLQTLSHIVPRLIDIHSQHANAKINDPAERLRIIDAMAENGTLRSEYRDLFNRYVELRHNIKARRENITRNAANLEFLRFQLEQLDRLAPKTGELKEIERRFEVLSDADDIKERLCRLSGMLGDSPAGVQTILGEAAAVADKIDFNVLGADSDLSSSEDAGPDDSRQTNPILDRIKALLVEAKDIYETVDDVNASVDTDPAALARLSERMNLYYDTVKRFRVKDADELVALHADVKRRISEATGGDDSLPALEREAHRLGRELKIKADEVSDSRRQAAESFSWLICETARPLGLANISFEARCETRKLTSTGQDEIDFLCSFNKNVAPRPIGDIASGGEIARMMLSLKSILAGHINLPTIIFDEVDTGVSGEIADKMGAMMHDVADNMQVIVITHLPQVAAKGDAHFKVYKSDEGARTLTHVRRLSEEDRVRELAAMISGSEVSEAALSAASDLLRNSGK